ncbi:hypothetical protein BDN70DRAFT_412661 [Pholiota conissans]|uniref:F-box domain-containing protein n=1 Tax=Pholiota conissans TaxID=109636 RepID=A0A9P5YQX3_9AGAR|nr:hypothetical protein BDN70DRAFT_412661 [Pholiota conissans]
MASRDSQVQFPSPSPCPISKVPYDVLRHIFTQCVSQHPVDRRREWWSSTKIPIVLSQVCFSWRLVTDTSPNLWCYLTHQITRCEEAFPVIDEPTWTILKSDAEFIL